MSDQTVEERQISPAYYKSKSGKELWDHWFEDDPEGAEAYCVYSAQKYLKRYKQKNGTEDLRKALTCINRVITHRVIKEALEKISEHIDEKADRVIEDIAEKIPSELDRIDNKILNL